MSWQSLRLRWACSRSGPGPGQTQGGGTGRTKGSQESRCKSAPWGYPHGALFGQTRRSEPISRVLSRTVIYLGACLTTWLLARYPGADRAGPSRPYLRLLRMGFTKPPRCRDAGGLLHHRFSFSLYAEPRRWESSFLRHFPSGCPAWPLASILPCGARTFLTRAQGHVARPSGPLRKAPL